MKSTRLKQFVWSLGGGAILGSIVGGVVDGLEGAKTGAIVGASAKGLFDAIYFDVNKWFDTHENLAELFEYTGVDKRQMTAKLKKAMESYEENKKSTCAFKRKQDNSK